MNNPSTCPHFPACSGCELIDIFHPPIWQEALSFFRSHDLDPPLITDGFDQTRYKAKLAVRSGPTIGLFKKRSHDILAIPHCLIHHSAINRAVSTIQTEIIQQQIAPYRENPPSGALRYIQLFVDRATSLIQLVLVSNGPDLQNLAQALLKHPYWHSIWVNHQPEPTNRILGDTWNLIYGDPFLWQTLNGLSIPFHPGAFSQTHLPLFEKMLQKIASWVRPDERVLELYAGVGAIGLSLPSKSLTLVENNPYAHLSFQQLKTDIPYLCLDAKEAPFSGQDLTIVDPPRKGLDPEVLSKLESPRLIYISCGFDSFKRDAEKLVSRGWKLKEAQGYLLFPGTNHVETLALFERFTASSQ